jgi:hypothetical protein
VSELPLTVVWTALSRDRKFGALRALRCQISIRNKGPPGNQGPPGPQGQLPGQGGIDPADFRIFSAAITAGMLNLAAVNYRKDIPEFSGDLDDNTTIEEWLKKAIRVGTEAGWTDDQKLKFFQSKLIRAAAS